MAMTDREIGAPCARLDRVRAQVTSAQRQFGRERDRIRIVAVSKGHGSDAIRASWACGQRDFGESYLQEAAGKIRTLTGDSDCPKGGVVWHFIGPIQSNKTRQIAQLFDWVHSVDREKIAVRLDEQRMIHQPPLNVCLQVNINAETSKRGASPDQLHTLAATISELPRLRLRGIMAIPEHTNDSHLQRCNFARVRSVFESLRSQGYDLDTLSMGMSGDLAAAVAEGTTLLRIGTSIFGPRPASPTVSR